MFKFDKMETQKLNQACFYISIVQNLQTLLPNGKKKEKKTLNHHMGCGAGRELRFLSFTQKTMMR